MLHGEELNAVCARALKSLVVRHRDKNSRRANCANAPKQVDGWNVSHRRGIWGGAWVQGQFPCASCAQGPRSRARAGTIPAAAAAPRKRSAASWVRPRTGPKASRRRPCTSACGKRRRSTSPSARTPACRAPPRPATRRSPDRRTRAPILQSCSFAPEISKKICSTPK